MASLTLRALSKDVGDLVASHKLKHAPRRTDLSRYASDPVGFLRSVLKVQRMWSRQEGPLLIQRPRPGS